MAKGFCGDLYSGDSVGDIYEAAVSSPDITAGIAGAILGAGVRAYCPQYTTMIEVQASQLGNQ